MSAHHSKGPPFSAISSSDNLRLGIWLGLRLGLGSVVWLWQYQDLSPGTTMNDAEWRTLSEWRTLRNGGPEPFSRAIKSAVLRVCQVKYFLGRLKIDAVDGGAVVQCAESRLTLRKPICFYPGT